VITGRWKWLRRLLVTVFAFAALTIAAAVILLDTHAGTRWVLDQIDRRIAGEIRVDSFTGTLWSGLRIPSLTYKDEVRELTVTESAIDLDWARISTARVSATKLSAASVAYLNLSPRDPEARPFEIETPPMPIGIDVSSITVGLLRYSSRDAATVVRDISVTNFRAQDNRITADSAGAAYETASIKLRNLSAMLGGDVPVSAQFEWQLADRSWSGAGRLAGSLSELKFDHELHGPYPASAAGVVRLLGRTEPKIDVDIHWEDWHYGEYDSNSGNAFVSGWLSAYHGRYDLELSDRDGRSIRLVGTAAGDRTGLTDVDTAILGAIGQLDVGGFLRWTPSVSMDLKVNGRDLDLSQLLPIPETSVGIDLSVVVSDFRGLKVTVHSIDGIYMHDRFRGRGEITRKDSRWQCRGCQLGIGSNRVALEGSLEARTLALNLDIDAPVLAQLWPGIGGALTFDGTVSGAITSPVFTGHASSRSLTVSGFRVGRVEVDSHESTVEQLDFSARFENVERNDKPIGTFDVRLQGAVSDLRARLVWAYQDIEGEASGRLDLSSQYVQGSIESASLVHPRTGDWQTSNAFRLTSGPGAVAIGAHAWQSGNAFLRIDEFEIADGRASIDASVRELPVAMAQFAMPAHIELTGIADSDIRIAYQDDQWFGSVTWDQKDTKLRVHRPDDQVVDIEIPEVVVDLKLAGDSADATASIRIDPGVSADLQVSLSPLTREPEIDARLVIAGQDWYWIPALIPEIDRFEGSIAAEIVAQGRLSQPNFSGELHWRDGSLLVPAFNVPVTDIDVIITGASDGSAILAATALAGGGKIVAEGQLEDLMKVDRSFTIRFTGQDAEIINWTDYRISASPDITISGGRNGVAINGALLLPRAAIEVRRIPEETVSTSADVTVIGRATEPATQIPVTGRIELSLGDNVRVRALGLDTRLVGQLDITVPTGQDVRAEGELTLVDGVFEAYGQRLTIAEGTLLFTGPLDDPLVNVRAIRKIESLDTTVTAGIELRGRARNLVANVFSEPAMAEADALSYLILGRPMTQATEAEGSQLSGAAVALGLRQAGRITNQVGQAFGLDQLDVSGDGGSTTALVAGKQLSSRLYIRYAYGVFSQLGAFLLRYKISRRFTLEASTGESHSMDILYLVEKP
jgi:translocation and assembly module TamB